MQAFFFEGRGPSGEAAATPPQVTIQGHVEGGCCRRSCDGPARSPRRLRWRWRALAAAAAAGGRWLLLLPLLARCTAPAAAGVRWLLVLPLLLLLLLLPLMPLKPPPLLLMQQLLLLLLMPALLLPPQMLMLQLLLPTLALWSSRRSGSSVVSEMCPDLASCLSLFPSLGT